MLTPIVRPEGEIQPSSVKHSLDTGVVVRADDGRLAENVAGVLGERDLVHVRVEARLDEVVDAADCARLALAVTTFFSTASP